MIADCHKKKSNKVNAVKKIARKDKRFEWEDNFVKNRISKGQNGVAGKEKTENGATWKCLNSEKV
jgi:hypothetical protein